MVLYQNRSPYYRAGVAGLTGLQRMARKPTQTYYSTGTQQVVLSKKRKRVGNQGWFKKKIMSLAGAKHCTTNDSETLQAVVLHNTIYTCNVTANVVNGVDTDDRIGDSIQLEALVINGTVESAGNLTKPCQFRIMALYSGEEFATAAGFTAAGLNGGQIFQFGTGNTWQATAIVNSKACTVVYDEILTLNNSISGVNELGHFTTTVPLHRRFDYQSFGSVFGKKDNLYIVVIGSISAGVAGTTGVGQVQMNTDLIFKQI